MAEATLAGFRQQFPELDSSTASDDAVGLALAVAKQIHNTRPLATLYCTAHLVTLETQRAAGTLPGGEVVQERAGSLWAQYRTQAQDGPDVFFASTVYGRHFLILEARSPRHAIGAIVV